MWLNRYGFWDHFNQTTQPKPEFSFGIRLIEKILQKSLTAFSGAGKHLELVKNVILKVVAVEFQLKLDPEESFIHCHRKMSQFRFNFLLAIRLFEVCYENSYRMEFTERLSDAFLESSNSTI